MRLDLRPVLALAALAALAVASPALAQGYPDVSGQSVGLRLDGVYLMNRAGGLAAKQAAGAGAFWLYDGTVFLADAGVDWAHGERDDLVSLGLGAYYPLQPGSVTPYLGGGLSYLWLTGGPGGGSGLGLKGAAGLLLGRGSNVQFRVEAGWLVAGFSERVGTAHAVPNGPFVSVGLALGRGSW